MCLSLTLGNHGREVKTPEISDSPVPFIIKNPFFSLSYENPGAVSSGCFLMSAARKEVERQTDRRPKVETREYGDVNKIASSTL